MGKVLFRTALAGCLLALQITAVLAAAPEADDGSAEIKNLPWQKGPATGTVGGVSSIKIPKGGMLLPEANGSRFLELTGNLPEEGQTVLTYGDWWAVFSFNESGYIKDDEKLDPDALLKSIKEADVEGNKERRKLGLTELVTDGWIVPPHYDPQTHHLEWGIKLHGVGSTGSAVNYTVRMLGRRGYESVLLVSDPASMDKDVKELKEILAGYTFNEGLKYSEFRAGDHVAEFGLGALVLGGAAAAASKTGFFKAILAALAAGWKLVAAAVVALFAGIRKIFGREKRP